MTYCAVCVVAGLLSASCLLVKAAAPNESGLLGTPWTGELALTETTSEIMARAEGYARLPKLPRKTPKQRPRGRIVFENLLSSTDSRHLTGEPGERQQPAEGQSSAPSFTGATLNDTGNSATEIDPDPIAANRFCHVKTLL